MSAPPEVSGSIDVVAVIVVPVIAAGVVPPITALSMA